MIWLLLACAGGASLDAAECVPVAQATAVDEPGDEPSGYDYCFAEDGPDGAWNRVGSATCVEALRGECATDADCGADEVCVCPGLHPFDDGGGLERLTVLSQCVAATCTGPDDCDDEACGVAVDVCGGPVGHYCRADGDACALDADCAPNERCSHNGLEWQCVEAAECE